MFNQLSNSVKNLGPKEFKAEMTGDYVLIDVRTTQEFKSGHIKSAINIPLDKVNLEINKIKSYSGKKFLLYCLSGARSSSAASFLDSAGLESVYNLSGGISAWSRTFG